jgi:hypothetical protein
MNRRTLIQYGIPIGAILIFVVSIIALATCGDTRQNPEQEAVLSAYQHGYVDGYSDGYSEGFAAGSRSNVQSQVAAPSSRGCSSCATETSEQELEEYSDSSG